MRTSTLFGATAIAALATVTTSWANSVSAAPAKPARVLWNQNSNFSYGIFSDNSTSANTGAYTAAADDFVVPAGKTWTIKDVDVTGMYYNGYGPASSEAITFYADAKGLPGKAVRIFGNESCTDNDGSLACPIKGMKLRGGTRGKTYWVSVVVACSFVNGCGQWAWATNTIVYGNQAAWENPGGPVCPTWGTLSECLNSPYDLAFDLRGRSS